MFRLYAGERDVIATSMVGINEPQVAPASPVAGIKPGQATRQLEEYEMSV